MNNIPAIRAINVFKKFEPIGFERIKRAFSVNKKPEKIGLHKSTFDIQKGSFVAILGPTGCGKSTLLKTLIGDEPLTSGKILFSGLELNEDNMNVLKTKIGYVPQDDIIHIDLTVIKALKYTANIRLHDKSIEFRNSKIEEVLQLLKIDHIRKNRISKISGGQRKRLAIAIELLSAPEILFLDEPTSPLDPHTVRELLRTLKSMTNEGTTVIMVTHKPEDLNFVDQAMFLAEGGNITYFGPSKGYLNYFGVNDSADIYLKLVDKAKDEWIKKYQKQDINEIVSVIDNTNNSKKDPNYFIQFIWLTIRNLNLKVNDTKNLLILFVQAPIIAICLCIIFDNIEQGVLFFMSISAIWLGANNAAREIVSEQKIYKRERMFNLGIFPYIFSKITVIGLITIIQSFFFTLILYLWFNGDYRDYSGLQLQSPFFAMIWFTYISLASALMGLLISALAKTAEQVMSIIPIVLIPQIIFAGIIAKFNIPFKELLSYFTISRWGTTGFAKIQENISIPKPVMVINGNSKSFEFSSTQDSTVNAVDEISKNFWDRTETTFKLYNDSMQLEIFVITFAGFIFFTALFLHMRSKHPNII
jgi:ABC-type multidrug transport system ATPase subunit